MEPKRDWGYAEDYVEAMWLMLQHEVPKDFVIGTGKTHSVRKLCELAFNHVGLDYQEYVVQDEHFYRPAEVEMLVADPKLANKELGWRERVGFEDLIQIMVDADLKRLAKEVD